MCNSILEENELTLEEKKELSAKVMALLKKIDQECNDEQVELVRKLMAEFCAFVFVCSAYPESK